MYRQLAPAVRHSVLAGSLMLGSLAVQSPVAFGEDDPYKAALPILEQAGGGKACAECFIEKYSRSPTPKAFAVSKDGAYGGRWETGASMNEVREAALDSCRKKPAYKPENPCKVFFENDKLVWQE